MANVNKSVQKFFSGKERKSPPISDAMQKAIDDFQSGKITPEQFKQIIKDA